MRILVTGAAGFIGSHLVDRLLADGHQVIGLDNLSTGNPGNLQHALHRPGDRFRLLRCDVLAPELTDILDGTRPHVVFHLAGQEGPRDAAAHPQSVVQNNVVGTVNLLEAARRVAVSRLVYAASGSSRYGAAVRLPATEDTPTNPRTPGAAAKLAGEIYVQMFTDLYGLSTLSLAIADVYGPRQDPQSASAMVARFGHAALTGQSATVFGDGGATRDYVYVDDVVDALVRAAAAPGSVAGLVNIGTARQTSAAQIHDLVAAAAGGARPAHHCPNQPGDVPAIALDSTRAFRQLGWRATVELPEGIRRTIGWMRDVRGAVVPEPLALRAG